MKPVRTFIFKTKIPSIEQIVAEMEKRSNLALTIEEKIIENPRMYIMENIGLDLGSSMESSFITHFICHQNANYKISFFQSGPNKISFDVQGYILTYLESILILTILDLGGTYDLGSENILKYIPAWAKLKYFDAQKEEGFIF